MSFYFIVLCICWFTLLILAILVKENRRIPADKKYIYYLTYLLLALAAVAEYLVYTLQGNSQIPEMVLRTIKMTDYILTPLVPLAFVAQMQMKNVLYKIMWGINGINIVLQITSLFNNLMIVSDGANHFTRGPLYGVYMLLSGMELVLVMVQIILFGRKYCDRFYLSLYTIILLLVGGISLQEFVNREYRTVYLSMTISAILLFIHISEFSQLAQDERIAQQQKQMCTDSLTGVRSRYAYSRELKALSSMEKMPQDLVLFLIDINGLKYVNDKYGHDAGDELIKDCTACITRTFEKNGEIFRIGGDEFVVLTHTDEAGAKRYEARLEEETEKFKGVRAWETGVSSGFAQACEFPDDNPEQLAAEADRRMYEAKKQYYRRVGENHRRRYDFES
ncbi:MAG: diguanylate cyclase [Clostridia bacterium]|nr:diguanylate cyclase [Clostridia bacterium]